MTDSQAVRSALREARSRRRQRLALGEEARRLAADPEDRAEMKALEEELGELTPDWPAD